MNRHSLWHHAVSRPLGATLRGIEIALSAVYVSPVWQGIRNWRLAPDPIVGGLRAGVVAHVYYPELWPEITRLHATLPSGSAILCTAPPEQAARLRTLSQGNPLVEIVEVPNRGRDIAPFVHLLNAGALDRFDVVLKVHTKKSPHLVAGDLRRRALFTALAGSKRVSGAVLAQFRDPHVGLVGPAHYFRNRPVYWLANRARVEVIAERMGAPVRLGFFEGSMFWIRPAALQRLRNLKLATEEFEAEAGQLDGTLHHAVERLFTLAASAAGFQTRALDGRILMDAARSRAGAPQGDPL